MTTSRSRTAAGVLDFAVRPDPDGPEDSPAVMTSPKCPSCGRETAVVFRVVSVSGERTDGPRVCLACCPKSGDHS
jgi:hypothetical protein